MVEPVRDFEPTSLTSSADTFRTGLGKAIAAALVQNGAKVYIAARKEAVLKAVSHTGSIPKLPGQLNRWIQTAEELNAKGPGSVHYFTANLNV